jgi:hypothetical protein
LATPERNSFSPGEPPGFAIDISTAVPSPSKTLIEMSVERRWRHFDRLPLTSALTSETDIQLIWRHVSNVSKAEVN